MTPENTVVIIGGGFSGTLAAVQLIRQAETPVSVILINSGYPVAKGVAYSAESDVHLLNVRAGRMSALPQEPLHFRRWLETRENIEQYCEPGESISEAFMPRRIYGQYIAGILNECLENLPEGAKLEILETEAPLNPARVVHQRPIGRLHEVAFRLLWRQRRDAAPARGTGLICKCGCHDVASRWMAAPG